MTPIDPLVEAIVSGVVERMTAREVIRSKPPAVRQFIRCLMTKLSLGVEGTLTDEYQQQLAREALDQWNKIYAEITETVQMTESDFAEELISRLRKREVWGKILRWESQERVCF